MSVKSELLYVVITVIIKGELVHTNIAEIYHTNAVKIIHPGEPLPPPNP